MTKGLAGLAVKPDKALADLTLFRDKRLTDLASLTRSWRTRQFSLTKGWRIWKCRQGCDIHPVLLARYSRDSNKIIGWPAAHLQCRRLGRLNSVFSRSPDQGHDQACEGVRQVSSVERLSFVSRPIPTSPPGAPCGVSMLRMPHSSAGCVRHIPQSRPNILEGPCVWRQNCRAAWECLTIPLPIPDQSRPDKSPKMQRPCLGNA